MKSKLARIRTGWIVFTLAAALPALAEDYYWNTAANGVFSTDGNWRYYDAVAEDWVVDGVPGDDDGAFFDNAAASAYTVTLNSDQILNNTTTDTFFRIKTDKVIVDLGGNALTFGAAAGTRNFLMSNESGEASELTIQGGGAFTAMGGTVGDGGTSANITLIGTESQASTITFGDAVDFGKSGSTAVTVDVGDHAELVLNGYTNVNNGAGVVVVTIGDGGTITANNHLRVGRSGTSGTLTVNAGGRLDATTMDMGRNASGTINVNSGTVTSTALQLSIRGLGANINIRDGGTWTTTSMLERSREHFTVSKVTDILVEGDNGSGQASLLKVDGEAGARLGIEDDGDAKTADRTHLTVRDGGQFDVTHGLTLTYMAQVAIDDGTVNAGSLLVTDGLEIDGDMYYASHVLTLRDNMIEAPALFQVSGNAQIASAAGEADRLDFVFDLDAGYTPEVGDRFTVLSYGGDLTGYFLGMAPNSSAYTFTQDEVLYELDYGSGTNDAITLTVIPEPHTLGLLLAAGALIALRRRAKR